MRRPVKSFVGAASLLVIAAAFLGVGWFGITNPPVLLDPLGIQLPSLQTEAVVRATALSEARATYGGLLMALGLLFLAGVFIGRVRGVALAVALISLCGLVAGRGVSLALDGAPTYLAWLLLAVEALGVLVVAAALLKRQRVGRAAARAARVAARAAAEPPATPAPAGGESASTP
jgi:Domain of unknown function (DUF4345)